MGNVIGTLAMPRKSLNNNFYWASELAKGDKMVVQLRLNHDKTDNGIIGESRLTWNPEIEQLEYDAIITDPVVDAMVLKMIESGEPVKVSLGLDAMSSQEICKPNSNECMSAPIDVVFREMSILIGENPGIPESSLQLMEMKCGKQCVELFSETLKYNTSVNSEITKKELMSDTPTKTDEELKAEFDAKVKDAVMAQLDSLNKAKEAEEKSKADALAKEEAEKAKLEANKKAKEESVKSDEDKINELVEKRVAEATAKIEKSISEQYEKKTQVSESVANADWTEAIQKEHLSLMEKVLDGQSITIRIDKDEFIEKHSVFKKSVFTEAVSTSGTIPGVDTGSQIVVIPGGILVQSIRPWVEVRKIPEGDDTVRFYTLTIPAFGNITEHVSTEITPATHTLTGVDVSANTPRGFRQNVLKTELEKYPKDLLEKIRETARTRAVEDECTIVLSTIAAATTADFGANHFNANDGTLVTDETSEDATGVFKAAGIEQAKTRLQTMGHRVGNGNAVVALTPKAETELIQDTAIVRFIQDSSPEISRQGRISLYFGMEIFVTNSINTSNNNSARNIVFMKGLAFGLAVGRDLELEFDKNINRQSVDIVATHRVNAVIKDATAYCILSSKND